MVAENYKYSTFVSKWLRTLNSSVLEWYVMNSTTLFTLHGFTTAPVLHSRPLILQHVLSFSWTDQFNLLQVLVFLEAELWTVVRHILHLTQANSKDSPSVHGRAGVERGRRSSASIGFMIWNPMWACYWMMEGSVSCSNFWFCSREESTATTMDVSEGCPSPGLLSPPVTAYSRMTIYLVTIHLSLHICRFIIWHINDQKPDLENVLWPNLMFLYLNLRHGNLGFSFVTGQWSSTKNTQKS